MKDKLFTALDYTYKAFDLDNPSKEKERDLFRGTFEALKSFYNKCKTEEELLFFEAVNDNVFFRYYIESGMNSMDVLIRKAQYIKDIAKAIVRSLGSNGSIDLSLLKDNLYEIKLNAREESCYSKFFALFSRSKEKKVCENILGYSQLYLNNVAKCSAQ